MMVKGTQCSVRNIVMRDRSVVNESCITVVLWRELGDVAMKLGDYLEVSDMSTNWFKKAPQACSNFNSTVQVL